MKSAPLLLVAALLLSALDSPVFAVAAVVPLKPIRGEVIFNRTSSPWESQQVQEPCIAIGVPCSADSSTSSCAGLTFLMQSLTSNL